MLLLPWSLDSIIRVQSQVECLDLLAALLREIEIGMLLVKFVPGATLAKKFVNLSGAELRCTLVHYEFVVDLVVEDHEYILAAQG